MYRTQVSLSSEIVKNRKSADLQDTMASSQFFKDIFEV